MSGERDRAFQPAGQRRQYGDPAVIGREPPVSGGQQVIQQRMPTHRSMIAVLVRNVQPRSTSRPELAIFGVGPGVESQGWRKFSIGGFRPDLRMARVRHMPGVPLVRRRTLLLGAAGGVALAGCGGDPGYPAGPLRIASGGTGGVYFAYAQAIATVVRTALPRLRPTVLTTAASVENLQMVAAGRAEVGFTSADAAADAFLGKPPFPVALPVAALGRIYENYLHLVVRLDRAITKV